MDIALFPPPRIQLLVNTCTVGRHIAITNSTCWNPLLVLVLVLETIARAVQPTLTLK